MNSRNFVNYINYALNNSIYGINLYTKEDLN